LPLAAWAVRVRLGVDRYETEIKIRKRLSEAGAGGVPGFDKIRAAGDIPNLDDLPAVEELLAFLIGYVAALHDCIVMLATEVDRIRHQ
jgi:hypothetical protein